MTKVIGKLSKLNEATAKNGREYLQIMLGSTFAFYWGDKSKILGTIEIGDICEMEFSERNGFCSVISIVKIVTEQESSFSKNKNQTDNVLDFMGEDEHEIDNVIGWLKITKQMSDADAEFMVNGLLKSGEIYESRPGRIKVL